MQMSDIFKRKPDCLSWSWVTDSNFLSLKVKNDNKTFCKKFGVH